MIWNKKYNYPASIRAILDGKRHYDINHEKLPSVTTIISSGGSLFGGLFLVGVADEPVDSSSSKKLHLLAPISKNKVINNQLVFIF